MVPLEAYNKLRMQLKNMNRKHLAFRDVLLNEPTPAMNFQSDLTSNNNKANRSQAFIEQSTLRMPQQFTLTAFESTVDNELSRMREFDIVESGDAGGNKSSPKKSSELTSKFDDLANKLDSLTKKQNDNLKDLTSAEQKNSSRRDDLRMPLSQRLNLSSSSDEGQSKLSPDKTSRSVINSTTINNKSQLRSDHQSFDFRDEKDKYFSPIKANKNDEESEKS